MKRLFTGMILLLTLVLVLATYHVSAPEPRPATQLPEGSVHAAGPARTTPTAQATPPGRLYEDDKRKPENNGGVFLILFLVAVIAVALMILNGKPRKR